MNNIPKRRTIIVDRLFLLSHKQGLTAYFVELAIKGYNPTRTYIL